MNQAPAPFSMSYTPNVPELLQQLGCTLALSTYQAGKLIFLSAANNEKLVQLPRTFHNPMGIALHGSKMAIATKDEVVVLANSPMLASHYPRNPQTYDALYMPRATYYTGRIDVHDLDFGADGLYGVNTSFSCLIKVDDSYSFTPVWKPHFIDALASEDRCHLNGMAMQNGLPKFVTAFGTGNQPQSWRANVTRGGILMDVPSNEICIQNMPMPHSPRLWQEQLLVLFSATGELARLDPSKGTWEVIAKLNAFVRGMAFMGDYAFVGVSRLRKNSSTFAHLPIADMSDHAGVMIVHLPSGARVGEIRYMSSVDEIYDVQVLPGMQRPGILNTIKPEYKLGLATPEATYWALNPDEQR
ncbi:MAG: TIGR03032 family protein [Bacteroidota bacterium]